MKVYEFRSLYKWFVTFPLRPLFIPLAIILILIGRINGKFLVLQRADSFKLFIVQFPMRLLVFPLFFPIVMLFGEMEVE